MKIRGGGIVAKTLKKYGLNTVFSLPGHKVLSIFDACQDEKINLISTRHELSAIYMAEGTSYASREIGVVIIGGSPELTNSLTGLAKAFYSHTPILVICGADTLAKRDMYFQQGDMDQQEITRPFTKWCRGCYDIKRIPEYINSAYRHALRGRPGPVYLEIPYDILEEEINEKDIVYPEKPPQLFSSGSEDSISKAAKAIAEAQKPILIAGSGILWAQAEEELKTFIEKTGIPLFITNAACAADIPKEIISGYGTEVAGRFSLKAIAEADLIILLGTRMSFMLGFGQSPFIFPHQKILQIDIEPSEIGDQRKIDCSIFGHIKETLKSLTAKTNDLKQKDAWIDHLKNEKENFEKEISTLGGSEQIPIYPLRLIKEINEVSKEDSILVFDGANSFTWSFLGIHPGSPRRIILSPMGDLGAIGAGISHAIAAKIANPERQVILHIGDGSFGYGVMEFETALRNKIPFVAVVHNDKAWGMTRDVQVEFYGKGRDYGNQLGLVRYDLMIKGLGGHGEFVEKPEDIQPAIKRAIDSGLPACVNVMIDPKPKSPGLILAIIMEIMASRKSLYDKVPEIIRKAEPWHLDTALSAMLLKYIDNMIHGRMK